MTSQLFTYLAASLTFGLIGLMLYDWLPHTPLRHSKAIRAIQSPATLIIYLLVILAAAVDFFQTVLVYP